MSKVLVTGATGFVGSNLARRLVSQGYEVSLIVRPNSSLENIEDILSDVNIFKYSGDINSLIDFMKRSQPDIVFHLASLFIAEHTVDDIYPLIDSNILFGTQLLEAINGAGVKKLINTGTSWQHYNNEENNPVCLYAATKQAFESIVKYYHEAENLSVITLKLFDTYGETDKRSKLINSLSRIEKEGIELNVSPGYQKINLVHIDDVLQAYLVAGMRLMNQPSPCFEEYGIGNSEEMSLRDLITLFQEVSGKKLKVNWGGREYRKREVFEPWNQYTTLPNWEITVSVREGIKRVLENE